ncbi:MAG: hypothetical protein E6G71_14180 [Alphaproteobacteria bacterium]|nr:MAG: hypothetical protein E6G71_14180 [Alphaproteobacteria bacterium]
MGGSFAGGTADRSGRNQKIIYGDFQVKYIKATALRRFATEEYVFDDQIADVEIVGDEMPNLGFPIGSRLNVRITHIFYMRDGKIRREIAYEGFRKWGGPTDLDSIPEGAEVTVYDEARA